MTLHILKIYVYISPYVYDIFSAFEVPLILVRNSPRPFREREENEKERRHILLPRESVRTIAVKFSSSLHSNLYSDSHIRQQVFARSSIHSAASSPRGRRTGCSSVVTFKWFADIGIIPALNRIANLKPWRRRRFALTFRTCAHSRATDIFF